MKIRKSIHKRLLSAFPDAETDHHEGDLYVKHTPDILAWLKENYDYFCNVTRFRSAIDGTTWLDIPFAYNPKVASK